MDAGPQYDYYILSEKTNTMARKLTLRKVFLFNFKEADLSRLQEQVNKRWKPFLQKNFTHPYNLLIVLTNSLQALGKFVMLIQKGPEGIYPKTIFYSSTKIEIPPNFSDYVHASCHSYDKLSEYAKKLKEELHQIHEQDVLKISANLKIKKQEEKNQQTKLLSEEKDEGKYIHKQIENKGQQITNKEQIQGLKDLNKTRNENNILQKIGEKIEKIEEIEQKLLSPTIIPQTIFQKKVEQKQVSEQNEAQTFESKSQNDQIIEQDKEVKLEEAKTLNSIKQMKQKHSQLHQQEILENNSKLQQNKRMEKLEQKQEKKQGELERESGAGPILYDNLVKKQTGADGNVLDQSETPEKVKPTSKKDEIFPKQIDLKQPQKFFPQSQQEQKQNSEYSYQDFSSIKESVELENELWAPIKPQLQFKNSFTAIKVGWVDQHYKYNESIVKSVNNKFRNDDIRMTIAQKMTWKLRDKIYTDKTTEYVVIGTNSNFEQVFQHKQHPFENVRKQFIYCENIQYAYKNIERYGFQSLIEAYNDPTDFKNALINYLQQRFIEIRGKKR